MMHGLLGEVKAERRLDRKHAAQFQVDSSRQWWPEEHRWCNQTQTDSMLPEASAASAQHKGRGRFTSREVLLLEDTSGPSEEEPDTTQALEEVLQNLSRVQAAALAAGTPSDQANEYHQRASSSQSVIQDEKAYEGDQIMHSNCHVPTSSQLQTSSSQSNRGKIAGRDQEPELIDVSSGDIEENSLLRAWTVGRVASDKHSQQTSRAHSIHSGTDNKLPPQMPAAISTALPTVDEDQESAFWNDVLKAKTEQTASQSTEAAAAAAPPSPRRLSHRQKRDRKIIVAPSRRPAVPEKNGTMHLGKDSPLPKARPGKNGITKLWTPGTPPRKPERPQSLPDSASKPMALLQRNATGSLEGDNPGPVKAEGQPAEIAKSPAENPNAKVLQNSGGLEWLSAYMDDDEKLPSVETAEQLHGRHPEASPTRQDEAELTRLEPTDLTSRSRSAMNGVNVLPDTTTDVQESNSDKLASEEADKRNEEAMTSLRLDSHDIFQEPRGISDSIQPSGTTDFPKPSVSDTEPQRKPDASETLWTKISPSYDRALLTTGASTTDPSSEEEIGYDDMVDSMMQAWNGGIPMSAPRSMNETTNDSDDPQSRQRRIFSMPEKKSKERTRKPRPEKRRGSKVSVPPADRAEGEAAKASAEEQNGSASTNASAVPLMLSEAKSLSPEEQERGVKGIREVFPDIHQTVAELTLKSYQGDVKEAVEFLKMTTLTATPVQLAKLGLVSNKAAKALQKTAAAAAAASQSYSPLSSASGDENLMNWARDARHMPGSNLADRLLQTTDPSEAIAMAINGAELTLAERERLREEEDHARQQWTQKTRAKQIFNEAAAQMEAKGQFNAAQHLRTLAYEQAKQAAEYRRQCNACAFRVSNQHVTNRVKLDLHGMSIEESIQKLENHIARLTGLSSATFVIEVITGIGKHSAGGIARLLPAVKQYLAASNLTWNEEPGNPGQINVVIASSPED